MRYCWVVFGNQSNPEQRETPSRTSRIEIPFDRSSGVTLRRKAEKFKHILASYYVIGEMLDLYTERTVNSLRNCRFFHKLVVLVDGEALV